jgi:uncharacterized protein (DUF983 family)
MDEPMDEPPPRAAQETRRGFPGLRCPACGEQDTVRVGLADMHLACRSCDHEFRAQDVRDTIAAWARVLDWIEAAPAVKVK